MKPRLFGAQPFVWGQKPPKWFMREVARAFEYMGKNREAAHIFELGADWSVVFLMVNTSKAPELSEHVRKWYMQTFGGTAADWPTVDSKTKEKL